MSSDEPMEVSPAYAELVNVLESLPLLVRETRRRRGLSQRAAATEAGVEFATISRCENGAGLHLASVLPLLRWIGTPDHAPSLSPARAPLGTDTTQDGAS